MDLEREVGVILLTNRIHPSRENPAIRDFRPRVHDLIMEELLSVTSHQGVRGAGTEGQET